MSFQKWKCGRCMMRKEDGGPMHVPGCPNRIEHSRVPPNGVAIIVETVEAFGPDLSWTDVDNISRDAIEYHLDARGVVGVNCAAERMYLAFLSKQDSE